MFHGGALGLGYYHGYLMVGLTQVDRESLRVLTSSHCFPPFGPMWRNGLSSLVFSHSTHRQIGVMEVITGIYQFLGTRHVWYPRTFL